jgi:hypothetical protein
LTSDSIADPQKDVTNLVARAFAHAIPRKSASVGDHQWLADRMWSTRPCLGRTRNRIEKLEAKSIRNLHLDSAGEAFALG